jgi:Centromere DNA-binding protein complex CBF3 subunit, domain 2
MEEEESPLPEEGFIEPAPSPLRLLLRNPEDIGLQSRLEQSVIAIRNSQRPINTLKAMMPKIREFEQFCEQIYPNDPYKYNINAEKAYKFAFYTAFREQYPKGGNSRTQTAATFNKEAYDVMMSAYGVNPGREVEYPLANNPIGKAAFQLYKAVIKYIHSEQCARRVCAQPWSHIWMNPCNELHKHVKERAPLLKLQSYQEKVDGEFAPYTIVERFDEIEEEIWKMGLRSPCRRSVCTNLRHLACVKYLTSGILRSESLHRAELSDFLSLRPPKLDTDVHRPWLLITQLNMGKTNHGQKLYGRATRHRNVKLCAAGGVAFYMMYRIYCTREFHHYKAEDWMDNQKWFRIKFLVDVQAADFTKEIKNDSYGRAIKETLKGLNIACNKLLHLGRVVGSRILEMLEEESEEIRRMGQWNPSTFDNSYSSKLPMGPIRKLAGFHSGNRCYFNTRTQVIPDEELLRLTPIGEWCYDALEELLETDVNGTNLTAMHVLRWFCDMNEIFLQDAAAILHLHPEREEHVIFHVLPVFQTPQWMVRFSDSTTTIIQTA